MLIWSDMEILSLKTFVRDFGSGPAVLFLHGWGSDETDFLGSAKIFSNNMRTILVDLWGFGKSVKPM